MKPEEFLFGSLGTIIIVSVVVAVVIIVAAAITIPLTINHVNKKYDLFVRYNSKSLQLIKELNSKYSFKAVSPFYRLKHVFDNKSNWYKTEPVAYLTRHLRENLVEYRQLQSAIEYNKSKYTKYKTEVGACYKPFTEEECKSHKLKYKRCIEEEKRLFYSYVISPSVDVTFNVVLKYISPKGQVQISKSDNFGYAEFVRILDSVSTTRVDRDTYKRLASAERGVLSDSLRYDVLRRDHFKCVLCGMSAKDGAILHVDHIIPVSKGGKTTMSNLRTLCEKCNMGKSNKIE